MDYFIPLLPTTPPAFKGSTLVLPQPSLASLPQLAADLLIHNYRLKKVGYLGLRDHVPAIGGIDSLEGEVVKEGGVSFAVEVYQNDEGDLTVVLPRSPVIRARKSHHLASMGSFIKAAGFSQVLLISSVDAAARGDDSLRSSTPLRHIVPSSSSSSSSSPDPLISVLSSLSPPYDPSPTSASVPHIPQGGLTRKLIQTLSPILPTATLLIYAAEGDNADSAVFLADALIKTLGIEGKEWRKPKSWRTGLLGEELRRDTVGEMYG